MTTMQHTCCFLQTSSLDKIFRHIVNVPSFTVTRHDLGFITLKTVLLQRILSWNLKWRHHWSDSG